MSDFVQLYGHVMFFVHSKGTHIKRRGACFPFCSHLQIIDEQKFFASRIITVLKKSVKVFLYVYVLSGRK